MKPIKILIPVLTACAAAFSGCKAYYAMLRTQSHYYTAEQQDMLERTTAAIGYGCGYDENVDLNYVFPKEPDIAASAASQSKDLKQIFAQAGEEKSTDFFERILYLHELTKGTMSCYEKKESWKEYTNISKYLMPALENYMSVLQKSFLSSYPAYASSIEPKRQAFAAEIARAMDRSRYTNRWDTFR